MQRFLFAGALLGALVLSGCSGAGASHAASGPGFLPDKQPHASTKIRHVIIVIQENRSFDNLFATFPGADGATQGLTHTGASIPLVEVPLTDPHDLDHLYEGWLTSCDPDPSFNCRMDGFDLTLFGASGNLGPAGTYGYRYTNPADIKPYWKMARHYTLADRLFQTQGSGSFTAHQDLIAGGTAINATESIIDNPGRGPWGCDAPVGTHTTLINTQRKFLFLLGPYPCLDYSTLRDLLDAKQVSWKYYVPEIADAGSGTSLWNAFEAIRAVRYDRAEWGAHSGSNWQCPNSNVSCPETNIFADIQHQTLPAVSWLVPKNQNSDHAGGPDYGPSWVAQVVNAIGKSAYWKHTAIVIVWDDWGGLYDHVSPPPLDYQGLGFRVPMIVVSPYARKHYISHTQYEFGSIVRFIEDNWSLGRLGTTDVRATSIADCFDFTQTPSAFEAIPATYSLDFFLHQNASVGPVDDE